MPFTTYKQTKVSARVASGRLRRGMRLLVSMLLVGSACARGRQYDSRDSPEHSGTAAGGTRAGGTRAGGTRAGGTSTHVGQPLDLEFARGPCDQRCARGALVQVFVGSSEAAARPVCSGAVIASGQGSALVLTAAHCLPQRTDKAGTYVVRPLDDERGLLHAVATLHPHPKFQRRLVTSPYDFALLAVPSLARARAIPLLRDAAPLRQSRGELRAMLPAADLSVTDEGVASLTLRIAPTDGGLCHSASGTPLLLGRGGDWLLAAVLSRGDRACRGPATAGLVAAAYPGFVEAVTSGKSIAVPPPTCAACQEEIASEDGPCVTPASRCEREPTCNAFLATLRACDGAQAHASSACATALARKSEGADALAALRRCLCYTRCAGACRAVCSATSP